MTLAELFGRFWIPILIVLSLVAINAPYWYEAWKERRRQRRHPPPRTLLAVNAAATAAVAVPVAPKPAALSSPAPDPRFVGVTRYCSGKIFAFMDGEPAWVPQAREVLQDSLDMKVVFLEEHFRKWMRERGVPEEAIEELVASFATNENECWLGDRSRW